MMKSCVFPFLGIKIKFSQRHLYIHPREWTGVLVESSVIRELRLWLRCYSKDLFTFTHEWTSALAKSFVTVKSRSLFRYDSKLVVVLLFLANKTPTAPPPHYPPSPLPPSDVMIITIPYYL